MRRRRKYVPRVKVNPHKINHQIDSPEVRVVGENVESGVFTIKQALMMAEEQELDLIEISPKANPPVCKLADYKKFLYEQKKKQKEIKNKTQKVVIKEIRFGPNTDEHDYQFKLKHAMKFLTEGSKVKAYVFFKGRTIVFKERGQVILLRMAQELEEYGVVEQMPKMEGKRMIMFIAPKKVSKK